MQVFVINLPEDVERRCAIDEQLGRLGLTYEVLPATRGKLLSSEERRAGYDELRFVRNEGRPALPGELGCALSHIAAYRLIVDRRISHALILEDDAWLNPNVPQLLEAIEQKYRPEEKNVFLLTWVAAASARKGGFLWSAYHLADAKSAWCAHGYVVANAAAEVLVETLYPVRHLADCWNWLRRHRVVNVMAVVPTCITADLSYGTQTSGELTEVLSRRSGLERLGHKLRRAYWRLTDHVSSVIRRAGAAS
jgi:glycosyl transferase family 25